VIVMMSAHRGRDFARAFAHVRDLCALEGPR